MKVKYTVWWTNANQKSDEPSLYIQDGVGANMMEHGWVKCEEGEVEATPPTREAAIPVIVAALSEAHAEREVSAVKARARAIR